MKTSIIHALKKLITGIAFLGGVLSHLHAAPLSTAFTYQGRLADGATPANGLYDMRFTLFDAASGGAQVGAPTTVTMNATPVSNGVFTVSLNFGDAFAGQARWLAMEVKTNLAAVYHPLTPRTELTSAPHALYAVRAGSADGVAPGAITSASLAPSSVGGAAIDDGSIGSADLSPGLLNGTFWKLGGNAGTTPGSNFVGTTDNQPLELRVNNQRALRLEPSPAGPNLIGGGSANVVEPGASAATISGGVSNRVSGNYATVGGGVSNAAVFPLTFVGGGQENVAQGFYAVIAGGSANFTGEQGAFVGGGSNNRAPGHHSTIAGGSANSADDVGSAVGGGSQNHATGQFSTVPGGSQNQAEGDYSFAAGRRARAAHDGSFVWADDTNADFVSTTNKQFAVRAHNGVMIQTTNTALDLRGGGAVRVAGAGVNSATPVFIHRASATTVSANTTIIDHPHCNGNPNAILIVTHNFNADTAATRYETEPVGVWYNGSRWTIFHENNLVAMPVGRAFNVMVVRP